MIEIGVNKLKKIASNFIYQSLYQVLIIIMPIITVPVVSRALGPKELGIYSYVNSITSYFVMVAGLGLAVYAAREIARVRDNFYDLSKRFWEIQVFNMIIASIVLIIFFFATRFMRYSEFYNIQSLVIIGTFLDITWFYTGTEDFKKIAIANTIIKLFTFILILLFIKESNDLSKYFYIQSSSTLLSQVILWGFIKNRITFVRVNIKSAFMHLFPALNYFIGKIAVQFYTTMNTTLLGVLGSTTLVGYYTNAQKLSTIFIAIIGTLDTVMLPQLTNLNEKGEEKEMIRLMETSLYLNLFVTIPAMFGIIATNEKIVSWFFGEKFEFVKVITPLLAPLIMIIPLGTAINRQYLIPRGKIKELNISLICGAISGFTLNLILIPLFGIYGSVVATLASQLLVTGYRLIKLYQETSFRYDLKFVTKILFASIVMLTVIKLATNKMSATPGTTIIQSILGLVTYFVLVTLLKVNPLIKILKGLKKS
ncbi:flippase [Enterococcus sp. 22-H-5-01]|uniref:flippase n=1 Tax=Enterococcus sp. 22-H-5-01 TaxID=3418555 RepID=UPI003D071EE6